MNLTRQSFPQVIFGYYILYCQDPDLCS